MLTQVDVLARNSLRWVRAVIGVNSLLGMNRQPMDCMLPTRGSANTRRRVDFFGLREPRSGLRAQHESQ
jgi:hypothetical protein